MTKIKSKVYINTAFRFGKLIVTFKNGIAEVTDEVAQKMIDAKLPVILEGESFVKTKIQKTDESNAEIDKLHEEYLVKMEQKDEIIKTLKGQLENQKNLTATWQKKYNEDIETLRGQKPVIPSTPAPIAEESKKEEAVNKNPEGKELKAATESEAEEDALIAEMRAELQALDDKQLLKTVADGLKVTQTSLKGLSREELIEKMLS